MPQTDAPSMIQLDRRSSSSSSLDEAAAAPAICKAMRRPACSRSLRSLSKVWRGPGTIHTSTLRADECRLPSEAWTVFKQATGLVILLGNMDRSSNVTYGDISTRLQELAEGLPPRVERITLQHTPTTDLPAQQPRYRLTSSDLDAFISAVTSSPCATALKELIISTRITALAAARVQAHLPNLEKLHIQVDTDPRSVSEDHLPAAGHFALSNFPAALQDIDVEIDGNVYRILDGAFSDQQIACVDFSNLQHCESLHSVAIKARAAQLKNTGGLRGCGGLRRLEIGLPFFAWSDHRHDEVEAAEEVADAAAALQQLQRFKLHATTRTRSDLWRKLAAVKVPEMHLYMLHVDIPAAGAAPPAPHLTHFTSKVFGLDRIPELQLSGCLTRLLPAAQQLRLDVTCSGRAIFAAAALAGHSRLQDLSIRNDAVVADAPGEWWIPRFESPAATFGRIPELKKLRLEVGGAGSFDALLIDAATCRKLEELEVVASRPRIKWFIHPEPELVVPEQAGLTASGVAALAVGACKGSLRRLVLDTCLTLSSSDSRLVEVSRAPLSVAMVSELLLGLPLLEYLEADVVLGQQQQQQQQQEEDVVQLLAAELQQVAAQLQLCGLCAGAAAPAAAALLPQCVTAAGSVGRCEVRLRVWGEQQQQQQQQQEGVQNAV